MTSLTDARRYPHRNFKWLYGKRWGVETAIFVLKSFLQLALISARTQPGVEQDLWASFAFYNQQSALMMACQEEVEQATQQSQVRISDQPERDGRNDPTLSDPYLPRRPGRLAKQDIGTPALDAPLYRTLPARTEPGQGTKNHADE